MKILNKLIETGLRFKNDHFISKIEIDFLRNSFNRVHNRCAKLSHKVVKLENSRDLHRFLNVVAFLAFLTILGILNYKGII